MRIPWKTVAGFGAHLKATRNTLIILRDGRKEEIPLDTIDHLLLMGGHSLHTSVVNAFLRSGKAISFFEADGEPLGTLRRYGDHPDEVIRKAQDQAPSHSYALKLAKAATINRISVIESLEEGRSDQLLYQGEIDIIRQNLAEFENLVRVDEIRRVYRLVSDMYYEIVARTVPPEMGFRRRTTRPHTDVVNSILSIGYGMLFGNAIVAAIGGDCDPDQGFLHKGKAGLIHDLTEPFKPAMIDRPALELIRGGLDPAEYECSTERCILSEELLARLVKIFHETIRQNILDEQVLALRESLLGTSEFFVLKV
ncbi:MAG: CRISPR-associated endonuclease Cas1 [Methanomicrobiales archaeon]|nr:CRISPR-associated endonuclease Cas1 [Methanomicrobiales archaeon]